MNIEDIITRTCKYFGITREELMSDTRRRDVTLPRQIAMYASRYMTGRSFSVIGRIFHKRHTTVLYTCDVIEALIDIDERVAAAVDAICRGIRP